MKVVVVLLPCRLSSYSSLQVWPDRLQGRFTTTFFFLGVVEVVRGNALIRRSSSHLSKNTNYQAIPTRV